MQKAKTEITRLIKEELIRLVSIFLLTHVKTCHPLLLCSDFMPKMFNFISRFFLFSPPPAKLLPADEQRPVQSAVEDEPRHTGGASIPHLHSFIQVVEYFSQDFL